ncbi:hypothetical protein K438DRAFT_1786150 [Mycena galopus ATCC 62051]|nr:hypothetical protein K438DRAFT_1786150 [Mycena galopus ATCC 62051]
MSLDAADVQHAISLIQTAYSSSSPDPSALTSLQSALRTSAAWGIIVPLLAHADANVQFFGAHTAQSKIARRELASLPPTEQIALRGAGKGGGRAKGEGGKKEAVWGTGGACGAARAGGDVG